LRRSPPRQPRRKTRIWRSSTIRTTTRTCSCRSCRPLRSRAERFFGSPGPQPCQFIMTILTNEIRSNSTWSRSRDSDPRRNGWHHADTRCLRRVL
jgi:hypothetical protein